MKNNMHCFYYGAWEITGYRGKIQIHNLYDWEYNHDTYIETLGL